MFYFYYVSAKINGKFLGIFEEARYKGRAIEDAILDLKKIFNVDSNDIYINYAKSLGECDCSDIYYVCKNVLKIDDEYLSFLKNKELYNCNRKCYFLIGKTSKDIKKLIYPGYKQDKLKMIKEDNKLISLIDSPDKEIQSMVTDPSCIEFLDSPNDELLKKVISLNGWETIPKYINIINNNFSFFKDTILESIKKSKQASLIPFEEILKSDISFEIKFPLIRQMISNVRNQYLGKVLENRLSFLKIIIKFFDNCDCIFDDRINDLKKEILIYYPFLSMKLFDLTKEELIDLEKKLVDDNKVESKQMYLFFNTILEYSLDKYTFQTKEFICLILRYAPLYLNINIHNQEKMNEYYSSLNTLEKGELFILKYICDCSNCCDNSFDFEQQLLSQGANIVLDNISEYVEYLPFMLKYNNVKIFDIFEKYPIFNNEIMEFSDRFYQSKVNVDSYCEGSHPVWIRSRDSYVYNINDDLCVFYSYFYESHTNFGWSGDNDWTTEDESYSIDIRYKKKHILLDNPEQMISICLFIEKYINTYD